MEEIDKNRCLSATYVAIFASRVILFLPSRGQYISFATAADQEANLANINKQIASHGAQGSSNDTSEYNLVIRNYTYDSFSEDAPSPPWGKQAEMIEVASQHRAIKIRFIDYVQILKYCFIYKYFAYRNNFRAILTQDDHADPSRDDFDAGPTAMTVHKALNKCNFILGNDFQCLAYAYVISCYLRGKGWNANICVGVRDRPFDAHAWVCVNNMVVAQDARFLARYSIIF